MNLLASARGTAGAVNASVPLSIKYSTGNTTSRDGSRQPSYVTVDCMGDVQAMQGSDLRQIEALNLNGTKRKIYLFGLSDGVVRALRKGGDVISDDQNNVWLVATVIEQWPNWCSVAVTLQNNA